MGSSKIMRRFRGERGRRKRHRFRREEVEEERECVCVRERENVCERERERECVMLRESLIDLILDDVPLLSILVFSFYLLEFFSRFGPKSIIIMFWAHT